MEKYWVITVGLSYMFLVDLHICPDDTNIDVYRSVYMKTSLDVNKEKSELPEKTFGIYLNIFIWHNT